MTNSEYNHIHSKKKLPSFSVPRSEIVLFVVLVIGLSWLQFLPPVVERIGINSPESITPILELGFLLSPIIAALGMVRIGSSPEGPGMFLRSRFIVKSPIQWYLISILFFPVILFVAAVVLLFSGESIPIESDNLILLINLFTLGLIASLIETYGWRGYLQEALQGTHSMVIASIIVGIIWGLWHAPLLLIEGGQLEEIPFGMYMVLIIGISIIFGWWYNSTDGSVVQVLLMHLGFNASFGIVAIALIENDGGIIRFLALSIFIIWLVAVILGRNSFQIPRITN